VAGQLGVRKGCDGFLPLGPWIVTAEELPDPQSLDIKCHVNGSLTQAANTRDMIFPVADLVAYISQAVTLFPGDVIATGTPAGVGARQDPPVFLRPGDEMRVEVAGIGELVNTVAT
jgi:2,4-diketo-3-deoxy-L-fuconate hydrolase